MAAEKENGLGVVPCISAVQKMALYETKARFYLVGSNQNQKAFRVLKIDRTEPEELIVIDDKVRYTHEEIRNLLTMIDSGNKSRDSQQSGRGGLGGLSKCVSAFGIFGFIRFCEGYYLILITKRRKIAVIGYNTIYKIEDTRMIRIPNDSVRVPHPEEPKYLRLFQSIDLSSNFYFSYSYDLSRTLQYNMAPAKQLLIPPFIVDAVNTSERLGPDGVVQRVEKNLGDSFVGSVETVAGMFESLKEATNPRRKRFAPHKTTRKGQGEEKRRVAAVVNIPDKNFIWNRALMRPAVDAGIHPDWVLPVIHGFVGQSNLSIFGRSFYLTLIARRSTRYAGTRYLKRGANVHGDVANEVETEQILQDAAMNNLADRGARVTSFVQLRGSIPGLWSQDISKMVPKPPIIFHQADPYSQTAGAHFNKLLRNYGSPIVAVNLVKKKEKKRQESQLSEAYSFSIQNLNVFLPPSHTIQYLALDMARVNKMKANVMSRLASIAHHCLKRTGIFCSHSAYKAHEARPDPVFRSMETKRRSFVQSSSALSVQNIDEVTPQRQTGIVRVNCVDCLDRTNTAQFAIGKCALAYQFYALGVIPCPELEFDTDCVRMLEMLYEDHGDFLALQYGGSQLVHRIQTYRRTAPWTAQGSDIMQTLSRYYSNAFSDNDKQNSINLLLGVFVPRKGKPAIWDLTSDIQLHNAAETLTGRSCSQWWDTEVMENLPFAVTEQSKMVCVVDFPECASDEAVDGYEDFYHPKELAALTDLLTFTMSHSCRDFMPNFTTDFSPFSVRVRPGKRVEAALGNKSSSSANAKNPSMTGQSSMISNASSNDSSSSESGSDSEDQLDSTSDEAGPCRYEGISEQVTLTTFCPDHRSIYGTLTKELTANDVDLYRRFAAVGALNCPPDSSDAQRRFYDHEPEEYLHHNSKFVGDVWEIKPPQVSLKSRAVYENHVSVGMNGPRTPDSRDTFIYSAYCGVKNGPGPVGVGSSAVLVS